MTDIEMLDELKACGTEQNQKIYKRHGVQESMFGVSSANLKKLQKKVKTNHKAAQKLWKTKNHDARIFATMIIDPKEITTEELESWAKDLTNYVVIDAFTSMTAKTPLAKEKMEKWTQSSEEWIGSTGWGLLNHIAGKNDNVPDSFFEPYMEQIEAKIHGSKNRTKYAMNGALISIGLRNEALEKKVLTVAKKIGKVEVDHGETSCKTPVIADYIKKTKEHYAKKKSKGKK